jgi:hypothetical protein
MSWLLKICTANGLLNVELDLGDKPLFFPSLLFGYLVNHRVFLGLVTSWRDAQSGLRDPLLTGAFPLAKRQL